jgi:opacity protein-like surface antigen
MTFRAVLLASSAVLAVASAANAADPIPPAAPVMVDTSFVDSSIYVQLVGGVALPNFVSITGTSFDTDMGYAGAATIGVVVMDGLSVEGDVFVSGSTDSPPSDAFSHTSASLMANLKYTAHLNDMFSLYAAGGVGWIFGNEQPGDYDYDGAGFQVILGAGAQVTDNLTVVAEYRYQNAFSPMDVDAAPGSTVEYPVHAVMGGIKLGF